MYTRTLCLHLSLLALITSHGGCTDTRDEGPMSSPTTASGTTTQGTAAADESSGGAETSSAKLDVAPMTGGADDGGDASQGCSSVDIVFVVDRSPSMDEEQTNLIASVPKWTEAIEEQLPAASDYRILIVDMDDEWGTDYCDGCSGGCTYNDGMQQVPVPDYPCEYIPTTCDARLGAGRIGNAGYRASNQICTFPEGRRWLSRDDENLDELFNCAARVGLSGPGDEQPTTALQRAVIDEADAGGCNEGFLRPDALLVAILVTDEDEDDFVNDQLFDEEVAPALYQQLVGLKGGDPNGVVLIGLIDDHDLGDAPGCDGPAFPLNFGPAPKLRAFIEQFPRHHFGSICAPDYSLPLSDALSVIDAACTEFVPEG